MCGAGKVRAPAETAQSGGGAQSGNEEVRAPAGRRSPPSERFRRARKTHEKLTFS